MKWKAALAVTALTMATAWVSADDLLGGGRGNSGGGSSVGSGGGGNSSGSSNGGNSSVRDRERERDRDRDRDSSRTSEPTRVESTRIGRSGRNQQQGSDNRTRTARGPIIVESVPSTRGGRNPGSIRDQARNEDRVSVGGYRSGYYHHDNDWNNCDFWYPWYGYNYNPNHYVVGPTYHYTTLPPYLSIRRVQWQDDCVDYDDWRTLRYTRPWTNDRRDPDWFISDALFDLEGAFRRGDLRRLGELVPRGYWVYIHGRDGGYRVRSDDFHDLMADLITSTWTRDFRVRRVEIGDRLLRVSAEHVYRDAWRRDRTVFLQFILEEDRRGIYRIIEFESDSRRPW